MTYNYGNFCIERFYYCDFTIQIKLPIFRGSDFGAANPRSHSFHYELILVVDMSNTQVLPIYDNSVLIRTICIVQ